MIHKLIEFSLRNRGIIVVFYLGLAAAGYWALLRTPIDAISDLSDNQVIVFTDWTGRSPLEVEDPQVTQVHILALEPGRATCFLLNGHHHSRIHSCLCADGTGRKALSPTRLYQNLRDAWCDDYCGNPGSGPLHVLVRG